MGREVAAVTERIGFPPALAERERSLLSARRRGAGLPVPAAEPGRGEPWVGVALSGGGIRSATFCLGLFQALSRMRLTRHVDLLSSVSGGGYFGGFLGALWRRPHIARRAEERGLSVAEYVERVLTGEEEPHVVRHLRENGRYLSPNGAGDTLLAGAVLFRNWVAIHVVLAVFALMVLLGAQLLWPALWPPALSLSRLHGGAFWWTPWALLPPLLFAILAVPPGWAYWLVGKHRGLHPSIGVGAVLATGGWLAFADGGLPSVLGIPAAAGWTAVGLATLTLATWGVVKWTTRHLSGSEGALTQRNLLSRALRGALVVCGLATAFAIVDACGLTLYRWTHSEEGLIGWLTSMGGALVVAAGFGRRIAVLFSRSSEERPGLPLSMAATAGALLLAGGWLVALDLAAQALAWGFAPPGSTVPSLQPLLVVGFVAALVLSFLHGRAEAFLNQSTHQPLYAARLTRAYLGASNPERTPGTPLWRVLADDDLSVRDYWGPEAAALGAPLHFVNVTVNETVDGTSQVQQQDRKGCPLALGPVGFHLGVRHHLAIDWHEPPAVSATVPGPEEGGYRVFAQEPGPFRGERLTLGAWTGISGAAFSTGTGYRTSLGLSLLTGMANIRLGRWWNPGNGRRTGGARALERILFRLLPVQAYLLSELVARFPGTAREHWYLSDGGHFENLGGYELIRRRLSRIVLVDAEGDPDYTFGGLADLVRKARVDFGAEIRFLSAGELDALVDEEVRDAFGTLEQLRRGQWSREPGTDAHGTAEPLLMHQTDRRRVSRAHATLAEVTYADGACGRLLYLKPTLCGREPLDVAQYHSEHPDFPHESTADQFFDEAQWESYRRLGEHIGTRLFESDGSTGWTPSRLLRGVDPRS